MAGTMGKQGSTVWLAVFAAVLVWSAVRPADRLTWFLEVLPAVIALAILLGTYRRFPLTPLAYWLILAHAIILMIGGKYTYAEVPFFEWLKDAFDLGRNNYDKVGHFAQGFVPAIVAREVLVRKTTLRPGAWLFFIVISICLAISAFYELIEWWVALASRTAAEAFLGTQGYEWDTQSDMAYALAGAVLGYLLLGKAHDRALARLDGRRS